MCNFGQTFYDKKILCCFARAAGRSFQWTTKEVCIPVGWEKKLF